MSQFLFIISIKIEYKMLPQNNHTDTSQQRMAFQRTSLPENSWMQSFGHLVFIPESMPNSPNRNIPSEDIFMQKFDHSSLAMSPLSLQSEKYQDSFYQSQHEPDQDELLASSHSPQQPFVDLQMLDAEEEQDQGREGSIQLSLHRDNQNSTVELKMSLEMTLIMPQDIQEEVPIEQPVEQDQIMDPSEQPETERQENEEPSMSQHKLQVQIIETSKEEFEQSCNEQEDITMKHQCSQPDAEADAMAQILRKRTLQEKKQSEKRRRLMEQTLLVSRDVATHDWDKVFNISQGRADPYSLLNINFFWFLISTQFFQKSSADEQQLLDLRTFKKNNQNTQWGKVLHAPDNAEQHLTSSQLFNEAFDNVDQVDAAITYLEKQQQENTIVVDKMTQSINLILESEKKHKDLAKEIAKPSNQKSTHKCVDADFLSSSTLARESIHISEVATEYFQRERSNNQKQSQNNTPSYAKEAKRSFGFDECSVCNSDEYDTDNLKLQCSYCENFVHLECAGEDRRTLKMDMDSEQQQLEVVWTCPSCQITVNLRSSEKYQALQQLPEFKPECCFCRHTGGIMRPTNLVLKDVKKTPGCQTANWTPNSTIGLTLSGIVRKECDYQFRLCQLMESAVDSESIYSPTFVYWTHLSCAYWLPQVQYQHKKPIQLKQHPASAANGTQICDECKSGTGSLFQCSHETFPERNDICLDFWEHLSDFKPVNQDSCCKVHFHVECARNHDYFMQHCSRTERYKIFCKSHKPLQSEIEQFNSFWERIDMVNTFTETYTDFVRKNAEYFKQEQSYEDQWTPALIRQLIDQVRKVYFDQLQVKEVISSGKIPKTTPAKLIDYRMILNRKIFPWHLINVSEFEPEECFRQYWKKVRLSEAEFKKQILNKSDLAKYLTVDRALKCQQQELQREMRVINKQADVPPQEVAPPTDQAYPVKKTLRVFSPKLAPKPKRIIKKEEKQQKIEAKLLVVKPKSLEPKILPVVPKLVQICCYCKCTYNDIKNQQDAYRKTKKFAQKDYPEIVSQQISVTEQTGNRCSKTGIISCSLRNKCLSGTFFHIKCVEAADPTFDFERKARAKWFCMLCRPLNSETCSESKTPLKTPDLVPAAVLVQEKIPQQVIAVKVPSTLKLVIGNVYKVNLQSDEQRFVSMATDNQLAHPDQSIDQKVSQTAPLPKQTISIQNNRDLSSSKQAAGPASGSSGSQHHLKIKEPLVKINDAEPYRFVIRIPWPKDLTQK